MPIDEAHPLLLASASPRRRELLERIGVALVVRQVAVDESAASAETPVDYLERIVSRKLSAARGRGVERCAAVLVADTVVVLGDHILGKPTDAGDAVAMISSLAGRAHEVMTRFAIAASDEEVCATTVTTRVWFRDLSTRDVRAYVATGEGRDKAGAYGIQGIGAALVTRIEGSYTNVVGLPLSDVVAALQDAKLLADCPVVASNMRAADDIDDSGG
jgi:septum formation protein